VKVLRVILSILLIAATAFISFKYIQSLNEKNALLNSLNDIKKEAKALENEKQNLLQTLEKEKEALQEAARENAGLKDTLKANQDRLATLETDFQQAKQTIEGVLSDVSALKAENSNLKDQKYNLRFELVQATKENESLKAKLTSIPELKKAIKDLKKKIRQVGEVTVEINKQIQGDKIPEGNQGFLLKDGHSASRAKVRIEVTPVGDSK